MTTACLHDGGRRGRFMQRVLNVILVVALSCSSGCAKFPTAVENETGRDIQISVTDRSTVGPVYGPLEAGNRLRLRGAIEDIEQIAYSRSSMHLGARPACGWRSARQIRSEVYCETSALLLRTLAMACPEGKLRVAPQTDGESRARVVESPAREPSV